MKLNPDCIRDILISVEEKTSLNDPIRFDPGKIPSTLTQYPDDVILYHVNSANYLVYSAEKHTGFSMGDAWYNISHHWGINFFLIFDQITTGLKPKKLHIQ